MSTIVTRIGKGSALTWVEGDANFTNLNADKAELSGATFTGTVTGTIVNATTVNVTTANVTTANVTTANITTANVTAITATSITVSGDIRNTALTASRAVVTDADKDLTSSATTATELGYVSGVTSAVQTQINNLALGRNRVINGAMRIDQRNSGAAVTVNSAAPYYGVDRWAGYGQGADGVFTLQQLTTTPPTGFSHYSRVKTTTADASIGAGQIYIFRQSIEGNNIADLDFGLSTAKTITLSFMVRSSLTGTFGGSIGNNSNRSYPFSYVINAANTWEQKTVTIAGDTTGTYNTDYQVGIFLVFDIGCGTTSKGTAGAWSGTYYYGVTGATDLIATVNATWDITGVQFEVGSVASSFENRQHTTELALCQRYYELCGVGMTTPVTSGSGYGVTGTYAVVKRVNTTPTLSASVAAVSFPSTIGSFSVTSTNGCLYEKVANATAGGRFYDTLVVSSEL